MSASKYMDVVNWVKEALSKGELKAGEKLNSEYELCAMFGVSRQTVRRAISELEQEGLVKGFRGSGTYIQDNTPYNRNNSNRIAVITTFVDGYIFPRTIERMVDTLSSAGYTVQINFTNNKLSREKKVLEELIEKDEVAGIICEATKSSLPNPNLHLYEKLMEKNIPIIFFNCYYQNLKVPHVSINDRQAGYLAARCLIEAGHKRIGGVFKVDDGQGALRYEGFLKAVYEAGLSVSGRDIVWIDSIDMEDLALTVLKIEHRFRDCTGIVAYNDQVAVGLIDGFAARGISVPDDMSIVGIDDSVLASGGRVELTSIPYPTGDIAEKVAKNLVEMIRNPGFDGNYEFRLKPVIRDSVRVIN